jgi:uncharacterized protein with von Willebrand factor type A (vWA) domain
MSSDEPEAQAAAIGPLSQPLLRALPQGRLAENVLHFVRMLRVAGLPVGPAKVLDALSAVEAVGVGNRDDFREALAAVVVSRREQLALFEQAFELFWRNPRLLEKLLAALLPRIEGRGGRADELPARLAQAMLPPATARRDAGDDAADLQTTFSFSAREVLQRKDFATMSAQELDDVKALLRRMKLPLPRVPVRRTVAAAKGRTIDLRGTLRRSVGAGGAQAPLRFRPRLLRTHPFCELCEISG